MQIDKALQTILAASAVAFSSAVFVCVDAPDCELEPDDYLGSRLFSLKAAGLDGNLKNNADDCATQKSAYDTETNTCYNCDGSTCTSLTKSSAATSTTPYCVAASGATDCNLNNFERANFHATAADCGYLHHYNLLSFEALDGILPCPIGVEELATTYYYDGDTCHQCTDGVCGSSGTASSPTGICIFARDCAQNAVLGDGTTALEFNFGGLTVHSVDECASMSEANSYYDLGAKQCFNCEGGACTTSTGIANLKTCTVGTSSVVPFAATPYNGDSSSASCNDVAPFAEVYIVESDEECAALTLGDMWFGLTLFQRPSGFYREAIYNDGAGACEYCDSHSCPPQVGHCLDGGINVLNCGADCTPAACGATDGAVFWASNDSATQLRCEAGYCGGIGFGLVDLLAGVLLSVAAFAGGDPHYVTWSGQKYQFHGECDTALLHHPHFAGGKGLYIHTRTTRQGFFSFVEAAAVKIGRDVIEVNNHGHFWFNGTEYAPASLPADVAGYPLKRLVNVNGDKATYRIELDEEHHIDIQIFHFMIMVKPSRTGKRHLLAGATGMMGDLGSGVAKHAAIASHTKNSTIIQHLMQPLRHFFKHDITRVGKVHSRDGSRVLTDGDEIAAEWQVGNGSDDPVLFGTPRSPVYPAKCLAPDVSSHRKLRVSPEVKAAAERACVHADANIDSCVFDVLATGNMQLAGTYSVQ